MIEDDDDDDLVIDLPDGTTMTVSPNPMPGTKRMSMTAEEATAFAEKTMQSWGQDKVYLTRIPAPGYISPDFKGANRRERRMKRRHK